jgi:Prokaryotic homologs of the JAB domain
VKALHFRAAVGTVGVIALLAAHLGAAGTASVTTRALAVSDQARRYLTLAYRSPTEFMGCMIGEVRGSVVYVQRIAPADVDPTHSTKTHVLPRQTCEEAGWVGTVGMIHSHPGGERCFYYFPGTEVASSDAESFARQPYPVDAIMCGDRLVWISRDRAQRELQLADGPARMSLDHQPGNRVHTGTLAARGE